MLKYILGLLKLYKIRFDVENCQNLYFLQHILGLFLNAEGKRICYENSDKFIVAKPLGKPWIISRLPQFSERINEQIKKVRLLHDSKLSTLRIYKEKQPQFTPEVGKFASNKDSFFQNNEALLMTYPEYISDIDFKQ